jgi:hypothetical protein
VSARYVDAGQQVTANQKVFLVLDLTRVVIAFAVSDTLVGRLALGQQVELTCDALPAEHFRGVVHKIGSTADSETRTFAVEVEQELTRKVEKKLAENPAVEHVRSISRQGLSVVFVDLYVRIMDAEPVWQDLDNKLAAMTDLPTSGDKTMKPSLDKDFGDTVAVMLTISSPPVSDFEVERRAEVIARRLAVARDARPPGLRDRWMSGDLIHPRGLDAAMVERLARSALQNLTERGVAEDGQYVGMLGAGAIDFRRPPGVDEARVRNELQLWEGGAVGAGLGHPTSVSPSWLGRSGSWPAS